MYLSVENFKCPKNINFFTTQKLYLKYEKLFYMVFLAVFGQNTIFFTNIKYLNLNTYGCLLRLHTIKLCVCMVTDDIEN